jgi:hypothetical protein
MYRYQRDMVCGTVLNVPVPGYMRGTKVLAGYESTCGVRILMYVLFVWIRYIELWRVLASTGLMYVLYVIIRYIEVCVGFECPIV